MSHLRGSPLHVEVAIQHFPFSYFHLSSKFLSPPPLIISIIDLLAPFSSLRLAKVLKHNDGSSTKTVPIISHKETPRFALCKRIRRPSHGRADASSFRNATNRLKYRLREKNINISLSMSIAHTEIHRWVCPFACEQGHALSARHVNRVQKSKRNGQVSVFLLKIYFTPSY